MMDIASSSNNNNFVVAKPTWVSFLDAKITDDRNYVKLAVLTVGYCGPGQPAIKGDTLSGTLRITPLEIGGKEPDNGSWWAYRALSSAFGFVARPFFDLCRMVFYKFVGDFFEKIHRENPHTRFVVLDEQVPVHELNRNLLSVYRQQIQTKSLAAILARFPDHRPAHLSSMAAATIETMQLDGIDPDSYMGVKRLAQDFFDLIEPLYVTPVAVAASLSSL